MKWRPLIAFFLFTACSSPAGRMDVGEEDVHGHREGEIHLREDMERTLGLETHVVGPGYIIRKRKYPAEVIRSYDGVATVRARFSGIVKEIPVNPGDRVRKGQVVARIESDESFTTYDVKSPISGVVSRIMVTEGVVVGRSVPLLEITDPYRVWIRAMVWPSEVDFVKEGKSVIFHRHFGDEYREIPGRIFFVAPYLDSTTRMIPVLARVGDRRGLRPGMYGDMVVVDSHRVNLAIPVSAVHVVEGDTLVFVKRGHVARPAGVSLGMSDGSMVEVLSGLRKGDTVFSGHSFLLRAEMEKEIWMGGHGHAH